MPFAVATELTDVRRQVQELRECARFQFQYYQTIAPMYGSLLPSFDDFARVACCDVSQSGVSFVTPDEPDYDTVVVALGPRDSALYVAARVINVCPIVAVNGEFFRVGCEFTERVEMRQRSTRS